MNSSHNQSTSATRGGSSSISTPANSNVAGIMNSNHDSNQASNNTTASSGTKGGMFENLTGLKRNSEDAAGQARRASLNEQSAKPGVIGQLWNDFTRGKPEGS